MFLTPHVMQTVFYIERSTLLCSVYCILRYIDVSNREPDIKRNDTISRIVVTIITTIVIVLYK